MTLRGLLVDWGGVLAGDPESGAMRELVASLRATGIRVALVTDAAPHELELEPDLDVDVVVAASTERPPKPHPDAFRAACAQLGLRPDECVVVDDVRANVAAAVALGMVGVVHESYDRTAEELAILFDR